jgi:hypothetical protein
MAVNMSENTEMARRMARGSTIGLMGLSTKENGLTMRLLVMASTNGQMGGSTWDIGRQI